MNAVLFGMAEIEKLGEKSEENSLLSSPFLSTFFFSQKLDLDLKAA